MTATRKILKFIKNLYFQMNGQPKYCVVGALMKANRFNPAKLQKYASEGCDAGISRVMKRGSNNPYKRSVHRFAKKLGIDVSWLNSIQRANDHDDWDTVNRMLSEQNFIDDVEPFASEVIVS